MVAQVFIRRNEYYDSIFLMRIAQNLMAQKGIVQAILLMGTEKNYCKMLVSET
jgi:cyclophilin family peptidyl-prolyl cis-trans isomerase